MEYITYEEFKEEVEKLGFKAEKDRAGVAWVETLDGQLVSIIPYKRYVIRVYEADVQEVAELSVRLAITPLDEREDRYYLRLKSSILRDNYSYLNYKTGAEWTMLDTKWNDYEYRTIFTKEEIDKLHEEHKVLDSFYMEKVND